MPESIETYSIKKYIAELRRNLAIHGLPKAAADEVIAETEAHLTESLEAAQPQSGREVDRVIARFGSAAQLAKRLASELDGPPTGRPYLWPVGFFIVAISVFRLFSWNLTLFRPKPGTVGSSGITILGHQFFPAGLWLGSIVLTACAVILFVLGYRARRPAIGQFIAAAGALTTGATLWYATTCYPLEIKSSADSGWIEPVSRSEYGATLDQMAGQMRAEWEMGQFISKGKSAFSASQSSSTVPSHFRVGDRFLLPEGIRELGLGIPVAKLNPLLLTSSWQEAVSQWNTNREGPVIRISEADQILLNVPTTLKMQRTSIENLQWIHDQPISVQLPLDVRMAVQYFIPITGFGMFFTLAGWISWLLVRQIRILLRRIGTGRQREALSV